MIKLCHFREGRNITIEAFNYSHLIFYDFRVFLPITLFLKRASDGASLFFHPVSCPCHNDNETFCFSSTHVGTISTAELPLHVALGTVEDFFKFLYMYLQRCVESVLVDANL